MDCEERDRLDAQVKDALARLNDLVSSVRIVSPTEWHRAFKATRREVKSAEVALYLHKREHHCCADPI